jgi:hypothetical protein
VPSVLLPSPVQEVIRWFGHDEVIVGRDDDLDRRSTRPPAAG